MKVWCAFLQTPTGVILVGIYQEEWESKFGLRHAEALYLQKNPSYSASDIYHDWVLVDITGEINYVIVDSEVIKGLAAAQKEDINENNT